MYKRQLFHQTALLRDIHLAAGVLHDIVHIVCSQTCCIVRYVVGLVVVSYTHLDVYKRQVCDRIGQIYTEGFSSQSLTEQLEGCLLYTSRCV